MQFLLLLQVCLLGLGLSVASPGRRFLIGLPPHNGPTGNVSHQVTITASGVRTSATVKVLESSFVQRIYLSAHQSKRIHLPLPVGMTSDRSSSLLSVKSIWPVAVITSLCNRAGCDHRLLHDVYSWGTQYYPITPNFPNQTSVSQMVITSSDRATSVDIFLSGEVLYEGNMYQRGSVLKLYIGLLQSVYLQSNSSLSGSELNSQEAVGVVVGFTCSKHTTGDCFSGYADLKPVTHWGFNYIIPPLVNTGISSSFLLAMSTINSNLRINAITDHNTVSLVGGVMKVIPVATSDKILITSDSPLQLLFFRHDPAQRPLTLTVLPSVEDICQTVPMFASGDMGEQRVNSADTGDLKSGVKSSQKPTFPQLPDNAEALYTDKDVGYYLSTLDRHLYSALCEKSAASCEDLHCGFKQNCSIEEGKPLCSLNTKICSAWGDSYYRMFDGRDFVLQGNCNYTLVQTTCPGLNVSVPLQINIVRAFLIGATVPTIHTVQISIQGFNIAIVKEDKNHVRVNGQMRKLPLTLGNGSLNFYQSGSSVVLDTTFDLALWYDWKQHLQVEVGPELYGALCGLCGNANHRSSDSVIDPNGTIKTLTADLTLPWVVNSGAGSCIEDCVGASCPVCTRSQTKFPDINGYSLRAGCSLLKRSGGPFADCHSLIDPEAFLRSCTNNLCLNESASSMCEILTDYANICQRISARVRNWRTIAKCPIVCPLNSHFEICGSACPATCGNPEAHSNCTLPCVESCQCNRGYLLSGGKCVPHGKCGCLHQGSYYYPKENFWMGKHCQERCVCQSSAMSAMRVVCSPSQCQDGEVCKVVNGVMGCHAEGPGLCIAKVDPHYTTFDGRNFDVYGNCTYLLTSLCPTWGDMEAFSVEIQNQIKDATNIVSFPHLKMVVSGYSIKMSNDPSNRVEVNGLLLRLPSVLSRGKVKLYMTGQTKFIETDFGLVVMYSSDILTIQMPRKFSGNLCGLCGNFNSNPEDDVVPDDDSDISQAVRHWKTSSDHECVDVPLNSSGCSSQDMALYEGNGFCARLLDKEGVFKSCHKMVDPESFYNNCVQDFCYSNQTSLCQILSSYVAVCQEMGAKVNEWRTSTFCGLSCPPNSEYSLCASQISDCVENPSSLVGKCKEGCFCKPGYFHSGGKCVPNSECGCIHNDVYYEIHENFYPDDLCQLHCVCVGHKRVQCTNHTCPNGTKCGIQDGQRACHALQPFTCAVMGGRHFRSYDGQSFDFNIGSCRYILSQVCEEEESDLTVIIQREKLYLRVHGVNVSLEMAQLGKVKIDGVLRSLPVLLDHMAILHSGLLSRIVVDTGVVVTYGAPDLIRIVIPASSKQMCGLCGNVSAVVTNDKWLPNDSFASDVSIFASSWSLSPPGTNCSQECDLCLECNSTMAAEYASANFCGMLLAPAGSFSECHSAVDPEPFFQNCVNDLCLSNGKEEFVCSSLRHYVLACQEAGAETKPWRGAKCSLLCPENSHYNICASACPESCGILSDIPCPWACSEACQCDFGYMQSGNGCVKADKCGCFHLGHYYEVGEISWGEGCSEQCNCSSAADMYCEPASCPKGESCTLLNTWGCAKTDNNTNVCEDGDTCVSEPLQTQCWVLGGAHFYTFDGKMFEFLGNCTYTLVHVLSDTSENTTFWVGVEKDRTPNEASSLKAIHVKVAEDNVTIYRGEKGHAWMNGEKKLLPVTLQFGHVKIYRSGMFVVVDTSLGIQVKYDCSHVATILLSNTMEVYGMCGNNNGIEEDDLRTPQGEPVDATTFGWSWRVPDQEAQCTADCGNACPRCSAEQLLDKNVATRWISMHEYIWSPQNPFYQCREVVNYTKISAAVSMFDLCSSNDTQKTICPVLEAYVAACQNAGIKIGEWRNVSFCPISCPRNSHYTSCGSSCPATCEDPFRSRPCALACVETCQCDPGFVLVADSCVPLSQCGCTHNGSHYRSNQTFWADDGCTELCVCDPNTHQTKCHLDSCGPNEYCSLQYGVRGCVPHALQTCMYSAHHIVTFDQHSYDLNGSCQYQLLGMCAGKQGLSAIQIHAQTDGHLESALHLLVNVSGVLVELNSKNTMSIEVDGVKRNMPYRFSSTALAFSLGLHTYFCTEMGFELSLSIEGIVSISLSSKYANVTCGLCGNFNSDPADDLAVNGTQEPLIPELFGKAWRNGQTPWCVEVCLGGSCPKCSSELLVRFSDPESCGKILEVNGPFRRCHGKVDPSSYYKRCVSDLCLHGGLQPALCHSLAEYAAVCLSHNAAVSAWRSPGFCYPSCPTRTSYNISSASVHLCLGWQNKTVEMPLNMAENCLCEAGLVHSGNLCVTPQNCGCFHHGEYFTAGQEWSTFKQSCLCHPGGNMTCRNVSCGEDEDCKLIRGVQSCHPKPHVAQCSVDGYQYTTFDGHAFEFHGSCNYTLVQTCLDKLDVEPILIATMGNYSEGRQLYLQVNKMQLRTSTAFPGKVEVNGVYENLPFSQSNITVHQRNGGITIKTPQSIELTSDLQNYILVKMPDIYYQTTCGLCGKYNDDPSDDLQLPNGTVTSDHDIHGLSWKLCNADVPCSEEWESSSDLNCGFIPNLRGPVSSCHQLVCPQKYYSLCFAEGRRRALCDVLQDNAACNEAGGRVELWLNTTSCAYQCPQFSHYSNCTNICSSQCPEISLAVLCPRDCEEGCQCDTGHLYDGRACVPAEQCGCLQDGSRFKASESKLLQNCTLKCTCGPPLVCKQYACPALHSCQVSDGIEGCHTNEQNPASCEGKCDATEKCYLSNGVPVCESRRGLCWAWGGRHYQTFDGLIYDFEGTCTYLLAASKGAACGLTPFSVSKKDCSGITLHAYGFIIKLGSQKGRIHVNGQVTYIPFNILGGKIQLSFWEGKALLTTAFGLHLVFDGNSTVVKLEPHYKGEVYGLCGNFNGQPQDEYPDSVTNKKSVDFAQAYQLFDGDQKCCTGCKQKVNHEKLLADSVFDNIWRQCEVLTDQTGPFANCHSRANPDSFYKMCVVDHEQNGRSDVSLEQAIYSYSLVCEATRKYYNDGVIVDVLCPPNTHYKTCGSACPPSCELNATFCNKACFQGCFCNPGFITSQIGCVRPHQCGCTDSRGKYQNLNSTFWSPDDCGQICICGPATGEMHCRPAQCPRGMVCKQLQHKRLCQPDDSKNCTLITGLHFTTFDGRHFDFRDSCSYSLVKTKANLTGVTPFNITISDASCHKRLFHSLDLTLLMYGLELVVRKDEPGKVMVDGQYKALPYSHLTGHVYAYRTPSSIIIHTDVGLQLIVYNTGTLRVSLPSSYGSSVSGLCGNANTDSHDDLMMPNEELAQNRLEFAHSWISPGSVACKSSCSSRLKHCPAEAQKLFEGSDFCGVLLNELGPFADCALVLSPKLYFHNCVTDSCSFNGHYSALCKSIASYAEACQVAQLPVRQWRSDTFCGMSCPKNSHYELCGPRCPVVCFGLSSPANCSGGCEEGCQCDPGFVLSDGQCVPVSDCGCVHEGQYRPTGHFIFERSCQKCDCQRGVVTCSPMESCSVKDGLALKYGVCQVFAGFGYITFDGVVLPHHGACTYVVSALSSKALHDYSLLLSFKDNKGIFTISKVVFHLPSLEVSIDPESLWKVKVNGEEHRVPFDIGGLKAYQDGNRLIITTPSGVGIDLSSTQYLRLTVPQVNDATASGLCGNFNGDKYDDLELRNGSLSESFTELLHSWAAPGQLCTDTCGRECNECRLSPRDTMVCDVLFINTTEFHQCRDADVERDSYTLMCNRAVCALAGHMAACLALEAYSAACQANGIAVGNWRVNTPCALQCPDRSSSKQCVVSSSNSCPAVLQPGSSATGCSEGCECDNGNVFDGEECVPYSQCGCVHHGIYIKMEEQVYNEDCTQRCWCHPLGGVICEEAGCSLGQQCALRNSFWGCHDRPEGCELTGSLQVSTLGGQQLSLDPLSSYSLMSLCDKASVHWFSLISYHGPCNGSSRLVTVFQILLHGTSFTIQEGTVKVNGRFMSLPHIMPSGVSLSSGVNQDKSEVLVILRRDAGMESELEIEIGVTMVTAKVPLWYSGKLCGLCGNLNDLHSHTSVGSWVLPDFPSCPHYQLYITAVQANAKVTVKVPPLNFKQEKTLNAGERVTISLPTGVEMYGSKRSPNTVRIEASADVSVTSINSKQYTADTSVVYPTTEWGTEYFIFTPASSSYGSYKEFSVTNGKESNKLEIFPRGTIRFEGRVYGSGSRMVIDLQPYESVQLQSVHELSGTRVASQHPVAVVTGHTCTWRFSKCNHVYEQLLPVSRWGSSFIVPPLTFQRQFDSVFLQASQPTQATVHHGNNKKVFTLVRGQTVEIHSSNPETLSIQADHGIQVLMLFNGVTRSWLLYYDPFLMAILSNDHFCSSYSLEALEGFENKALIVARTSAMSELRIDGKNLPHNVEWKKVTGTDFSWAEMSYQQIPGNNKHTVSSSGSRFALYSIGVSQMNGYGTQGQCIQPGSGSLSCSSITCSANEVCEVKGGFPSCVPKAVERKPGTCWATGDPHYRTFDGRHFDFMGTCTYVIAKNCGKDDHLPDFEVLAQNENRGSLRVSYVAVVTVKVYGVIITVVRSETGRVRIDNSLWSLPITLKEDKLTMIQSGRSVVIETDFGLTVRYDWEHNLGVTLSSSYAGKTCGLCGNFNDNPNDDFTTPSGTQAGGAVAFGSSWKVPVKGAVCRDDCVGGCERCENSLMKIWGGDMFCGLITLIINGPFSKCHAVIDPQAYLENCKYDVCMGGGLRHFLCRTLEAYTEACQIAGIQVQDWRKMARCTAKCPANSHYELCGNACPATCSDPNTSSKCKRPCVEICTCNTGFLLSGGQCVPAARCGCSYEGRNIPAGESFWADQGCLRRCKCVAGSRRVECQDKGCRAGQQCQVVGGIRECQAVSHSTCQATGDPHYVTFDNKKFDFQGTCVYQLAALCSKDPELVPFEVLVQNDHRGHRVVSYTKLVEIKVHSLSIVITKTHKGLIMVNKELVNLPVTLDDGRVSVFKSGWSAVVKTNFGLKVSFNWYGAVFVTLPSNYMGAVCGLCGNYNGKPQDDLTPKNGDKPVLPADFGVSWRVAEIPGCVDGCKGVCPSCDITQKVQYEKGDFCGLLRDPKGPFRDCHAKVDPAGYFEDCVYDVCLYEGRKDVLCQAITSYTSACQAVGAKMYRWRSIHYCAVKCPVHSHYEVCAPGCPASCQSLIPPQGCEAQCAEGCSCDEGYILSGDRCVPFSQCGCVYDDRYYRIGQVFYPNGQCQEECKCTQDDEVVCKKFTCGPNEKCKVEDGVQQCHPVGKGVCHASGDPHYHSFDGRTFNFQGTCTYTLSKSCGLEGTHLEAFSVQVENERWNKIMNKMVAVTKLVAVDVYGFTLIMRNNMFGVLVNGVFNYLPVNLNDGAVLVYQEGLRYVIATDFGLIVTYDLVYHVTVTVPGNYRAKVCGLCGNFNGEQKDDFQMPNRKPSNNVNVFGKSWKVTIPNVVCENGCKGKNCPVCDPARKAVFSKSTYCGIVTAANGPFAACHSKLDPQPYFADCVFDVCASNGDGKVLCNSIAAYAFNCHMAGVDVKNWRTPSFCPMKCPANSHYEVCADACSASCADLTEIAQCSSSCTEGCECDAGFLFNGHACVQETECGCYDNGRSYKPGEVVYEEDCNTKCTCNPETGIVCEKHSCPQSTKCMVKKGIRACYNTDPCKDACRVKEKCRVEKSEAVCVPEYTGTCWAWGDPHYHTFDGFNFNFQGTCKYVISKTCGNLDGLVPFSVTERNDNRGNTAVSFVREVDVSVYGYNITLRKNRVGRVTVDGEQLNLPVQLGEGQGEVSVSQRGHTAVVETDFGLSVSYDWNWKLVIKLPSSYYASVCGLCGNFNGNNGDELQNPAGKAVSSVKDWGKSWQTPEQDEKDPCWDTCEKDCPTCDSNQKKLYESGAFCGGLKAKTNNVFKPCHGKLDPQAFMNNCVYDMCLNKGDKKMLCQALASYSQQCRGEGIIIKDWRRKFGCPMSCQRHSHYDICTSPCQPSCPFPDQKSPCPGACVEACVCDKGYVLSAGVCVPAKSCGCSYQGRYYKPGQHFWADEACGRLCECDTTLGMVTCHEASCSAQEMCTVVDGERTCRPISHATCTASGDPHYRTFDGRRFDFQGTCVYQLVGLCSQQQGLVPFKVTVQNDHRGSKAVSYTRTVTFSIYGITLTISREYPHKVLLNGQLASLPLDYNNELVVFLSGGTAVVETDAGITVTFDWRGRVSVSLPSNYQGAVCGLCGNYNGKAQDDLTMRNGQTSKDGAELGESWQVALVPGCSSVCQGAWCQACSDSHRKKYQAQKYCGIIADLAGPFRDCHSSIEPAPYLEDCVYDACQYHGHQGSVCDAVGVYVSACQSQGITIRSWRTDAFCPMVCPANSHYTLYATGCPVTCASLTSLTTCHRACSEACECDEGYLQSGDTCVPVRDCGCSYDGQYYRKGDVFYPETECVEQCVCGENSAVSCQKAKCRAGETCKLVNGMKGCHPDGQGKCVASGDPHYISFDGKRFDFQGTCVYMLAKVCDDDKGRLTPFSVTQGNEKYGNGKVAVTKSIAVAVYGYVIYIQQKVPWKVTVDDEILNLPLYLDNGRLRVTQEGRNIIIRTDFGLTVLYDTVYYVEVIMPSSYQGKMCGLCGNYNKNNGDDFRLPGGRKTNSVDDFGKSWVVDMPGNVCGGCGGQCPVCEQAKATLYGKSDSCGFMSAPNGPFKACHSQIDPAAYVSNCVFDVCAVDGNKDNLCNSVQAYALACQSEGVQIQPWRSSSFCPASCPANSHYEVCADTCGGACASFIYPFTCSESCFEGCQCDASFVFDGMQCVPLDNCGCVHNGRYLTVGQADVDKACTSKCVCQASGVVNCEKLTCASGEVCDVREGVRGCHVKQGHCSVSQVGLLTSFDGMSGAIGAQGAFEVASLCNETDKMWFRVVVDVRVCSKGASPTVATLYVFFKETVVTVNSQHVTWVNGRKMSLPSKVTSDISVHISEKTVIIEKPSAVRLTYSLSKEVTVIIDSSLSGKMCGACGNYNNNSKDDMRTADGKITTDVSVVVGSWSAGDFSRCGL
ncbi:IgGFc-binding protein [Pseudochaenichthys georgianus]|uniref:IgGFc-binding protein n=1 Tax=Pseudochaenichthys georgianus TaxID=52239 RepID=UPI00146EF935|nr:IgGFc-binding protein [Pseudochaenichthys georgianus]